MDKIHIQEIEVQTHIGVSPEERAIPQPVKVSLRIGTDFSAAVLWDDVTRTVDYFQVSQHVRHFVEGARFNLLETLAEKLSEELFLNFSIQAVQIRIDKPKALLGIARMASVEIYRERLTQ